MGSAARLLVIGVGNRDRGDDAVGPIVCDLIEQLDAPGIATLVCEGSVVDLAIHWSPNDRVVIVDAAEPDGDPGRITTVDAMSTRLTAPGPLSTHSIDVSAAIEVARALERLPARLTIVGIEAAGFEFGAPLSPAVEQAAERVASDLVPPWS